MTLHAAQTAATPQSPTGVQAAIPSLAARLIGGQPAAVMADVAEVLRRYALSQLPGDLITVSADGCWLEKVAAQSYRHANGFSKLVLADSEVGRLRLHIWEPGAASEENIHEHRWHFASVVMTGAIESEIWVDAFDRDAPTFEEFIYEVRAGRASRRPVGHTRAACARTAVRQAGDAYYMLPGVMHRITRTNGVTATLVFTTAASRSWNRMLADKGVHPNVEKHPLQADEVRRLIDLLVAKHAVGESRVHRH